MSWLSKPPPIWDLRAARTTPGGGRLARIHLQATLLGVQDRVAALIKSDSNCVRERGELDVALIAYSAYAEQRPEIEDLLLRSGTSVQGKALGGASTLHLAANKGYVELAAVLLNHGADVNTIAMSRGQEVTPLAIATGAKREK